MSGKKNNPLITFKKKIIINCLILLLGNFIYCQSNISGVVTDSTGNAIAYANVILKPVNSDVINKYTTTDEEGEYSIHTNQIGNHELFFSAISHTSLSFEINLEANKNYFQNAKLKDEVLELDEIIIKKEREITIKKDTITFNAKAFLQGNEEVVEDLLKKIPGLNVSNDGTIKVGNQEVEKIMIDNDDFFEKGYKILTKNMPVNSIDKIELYQHYSNNKHLKGVENSDKVAINLKLKDDAKRQWFGNMQMGYGLVSENRYDLKSNLMNFGKNNKYYLLTNFNNIGFDATGDIEHLIRPARTDEISSIGDDQIAITAIELNNEKPNLNPNRINFNNTEMVSVNSIFKLSDKTKLKTLGFLNTDENSYFKNSLQSFQISNSTFENYENYIGKQEQITGFGKVDLTYDISKTKTFVFSSKYNYGSKKNRNELNFNSDFIDQKLANKNQLLDQKIVLTNKFKENSVLLFTLRYINEKTPQIYTTNKFIYQDIFNTSGNNIEQTSSNKMDFIGFETHLINRNQNENIFEIQIGNQFRKDNLLSIFKIKNDETIVSIPSNYKNTLNYVSNDLYLKLKYSIKFKKIRLDTETTFHQYINTLNDTLKQNPFFANPKIGISWEINQKNRISTSFSLNKTNTKVLNIYNNYINTGFRSFLKGTGSLNLLNASLATLNHTYGNWGDKFFANTYIIYSKNHEYISTNSIVSQNYSQSENIIIKDKNFLLFSSNIDKYFKPILTNIKLTIGGTKSNFQNIVNNSDLRTVINSSFNYGFELRSSFKDFLNFNIGSKWEYNEVNTIFKNSYNENNSFIDLYFILNKKINFQLETERYYNSNLDKKNNKYYFMDLELNYVPNKNKLSFSILANNLFNTKTFKNYLVDDVSISKTEYRLLPRYILLKIDFRF